MSARDEDRFKALKGHLVEMTAQERAAQDAKTDGRPGAIFDLIERGDAAGVACAVQNNVSIDQQDQNGLTPLHHAAGRDARLIADVLTASPNKAPWTRDAFGRLPLDVAREAGNNELGDRLERYTYPQLYRHEQDGPVPSHQLKAFNELRQALDNRDTSPAYAPDKMREEQAQRLMAHERDDNEIER